MDDLLNAIAEKVASIVIERMQPQQKEWFSPEDIAERYGVSADTARTLIRNGKFGEPLNLGDRLHRVSLESVKAFEETNTYRTRYEHIKERRTA